MRDPGIELPHSLYPRDSSRQTSAFRSSERPRYSIMQQPLHFLGTPTKELYDFALCGGMSGHLHYCNVSLHDDRGYNYKRRGLFGRKHPDLQTLSRLVRPLAQFRVVFYQIDQIAIILFGSRRRGSRCCRPLTKVPEEEVYLAPYEVYRRDLLGECSSEIIIFCLIILAFSLFQRKCASCTEE